MSKPNIIVVEGIDRVGKTTLVKRIVKEFGYSEFVQLNNADKKKERKLEIEIERMYSILSVLALIKNDYIILDRYHLSEMVYGIVDRRYYNIEVENVDRILSKLNSFLVYVEPEDIKWSSKQHGSSLLDHDRFFKLFYEKSKMNKAKCSFSNFDFFINLNLAGEK